MSSTSSRWSPRRYRIVALVVAIALSLAAGETMGARLSASTPGGARGRVASAATPALPTEGPVVPADAQAPEVAVGIGPDCNTDYR